MAKLTGAALRKEIISWVVSLAVVLIVVFLVRTFLFTMIRVDGDSMRETLHDGDRIASTIIDLKFAEPTRGQIVTLHYPGDTRLVIKRMIGLPGDTLEIKEGVTYLNGEEYLEPYVVHPKRENLGPIVLAEDQYFVMGDNRANSEDSRRVGPVSRAALYSNARLRLWPLSKIGMVY